MQLSANTNQPARLEGPTLNSIRPIRGQVLKRLSKTKSNSSNSLGVKLFLIVLGLTSYIPVNFIGTLKVAEIIALGYVVYYINDIIQYHYQSQRVRWYFWGNAAWITIGSISTYYNSETYPDLYAYTPPLICFLKGFANIVFVYISTMVFMKTVGESPERIPYYLVPLGISTLVFSPYHYSFHEITSSNFFLVDSSTVQDNYFDVHIAPLLTPLAISLPWILRSRAVFVYLPLIAYGIVAVLFDARATGLIFFLSGLAIAVSSLHLRITLHSLVLLTILGLFTIIPTLKFLASQGLLGRKGSEQVIGSTSGLEVFNPVLIIGRPAATVATFAIIDSPLFGHGFNKQDRTFFFTAKEAGYLPSTYEERYSGISAHSNLLNAMVEAGILAGISWILILTWSFQGLSRAFDCKYSPVAAFVMISFFYLLWNVLFSGTMRLDFGYIIAVLLINKHVQR